MKKTMIQIIKFGILGAGCSIIEWLLFYFINTILGVNYFISTFGAYLVSTIVNYYFSLLWVFNSASKIKNKKYFNSFIMLSLGGVLFNELFMFIFIEKFKIINIFAKILSTFIVMIYNFISRKLLLEKE